MEFHILRQNLKKYELVLEKVLQNLVKAIAVLQGVNPNFDMSVNFDDPISEDVGAEKQRFLQEICDGICQKWEY